jgi:hypothetical protein
LSWLLWGQCGKGGLICRSQQHQRICEGVCEGVSKGVGALDSFWQCQATEIWSTSLRVAAWLFFQLIILRYFYWRSFCVCGVCVCYYVTTFLRYSLTLNVCGILEIWTDDCILFC